jgi:hypothetical protein
MGLASLLSSETYVVIVTLMLMKFWKESKLWKKPLVRVLGVMLVGEACTNLALDA